VPPSREGIYYAVPNLPSKSWSLQSLRTEKRVYADEQVERPRCLFHRLFEYPMAHGDTSEFKREIGTLLEDNALALINI